MVLYIARNLIFREKKIQLALQYLYIHGIHPKNGKYLEKKNSMKFQKAKLEFATRLQLFT